MAATEEGRRHRRDTARRRPAVGTDLPARGHVGCRHRATLDQTAEIGRPSRHVQTSGPHRQQQIYAPVWCFLLDEILHHSLNIFHMNWRCILTMMKQPPILFTELY
jgi:hypothetical protein